MENRGGEQGRRMDRTTELNAEEAEEEQGIRIDMIIYFMRPVMLWVMGQQLLINTNKPQRLTEAEEISVSLML